MPWHIIILAIIGAAILTGAVVALPFALTRPVVTASDAFMTAVKNRDFRAAYAMGTPALQRDLGSIERFGAMFDARRPASWSWSRRQIRNGTGRVSGSVVYAGGGEGDAIVFLLPEGDDWKISGFKVNPR